MEVKEKFAMGKARNVLQTIYQSEFVNHTCRVGMMINPQILRNFFLNGITSN